MFLSLTVRVVFCVCMYVYGIYVTWEIIHMCKYVCYCLFLLVIFGVGSALQSWRWWPCCPSSRGHACWVLCRNLCKPETRRRCSCSGANSPWTCTHRGRLSAGGTERWDACILVNSWRNKAACCLNLQMTEHSKDLYKYSGRCTEMWRYI